MGSGAGTDRAAGLETEADYIVAQGPYWDGGDVSDTIDSSSVGKQQAMPEKRRFPCVITPPLKGEGFDASEDGTGRGTPLVPIAYRVHGENSTAMKGKCKARVADEVETARALDSGGGYATGQGGNIVQQPVVFDPTQITHPENRANPKPGDPSPSLAKKGHPPVIAFSWHRTIADPVEDKTPTLTVSDGHVPAVVAYQCQGSNVGEMGTLRKGNAGVTGGVPFVFEAKGAGEGGDKVAPTLRSLSHDKSHANAGGQLGVAEGTRARRLTVRECERLQGLPDNWTRIPGRRYARRKITKNRPADMWERDGDGWKLMMADGPRYHAIGNSMAVPVMTWLARRIELVEEILKGKNSGRKTKCRKK